MSHNDVNSRTTPAPPAEATRKRAALLATLGNVLEWYDFTVYGFLAAYIAATFFPGEDPVASLLSAFGIFAVGFIARPLGALVLGPLVDRSGRKSVMLFSMMLMAAGSLLVGIAPSFATAGILGAFVITLGRLCQGFSAGGEFGSSAVFLVEWASPKRRGLYGSFHQIATYGGLIFGVILVTTLTAVLGAEAMAAWAWRIPFIFGGLLAIVVLIVRRRVEETPTFVAQQEGTSPSSDDSASEKYEDSADTEHTNAGEISALRGFLLTIGVTALWGVTSMVTINYMPTYAATFANLSPQSGLLATSIGGVLTVALIPVAGHLSDKYGRKPFIFAAAVLYIILPFPLFSLIVNTQSFWAVLVTQLIFAIPTAAMAGVGTATISELFATKRRGSLVSIGSAIAVTLFGGFGAYICTALIGATGQNVAPSYYIIGVATLTLVTGFFLPNLAHRQLRD